MRRRCRTFTGTWPKVRIREVEGGDRKFDPRIFLRAPHGARGPRAGSCDIALIRGERGWRRPNHGVVAERLGRDVPVTVIRDAGHHLMLDQPIAPIAVACRPCSPMEDP